MARRGSDAVSGRAPSPASDRPADAPRTRAPRGPHDRLVSIVTPSLNQGPFIEDTIRSVLTQSYAPLEHIVVDGVSTDETASVVACYPDVVWNSEPDHGTADALNRGVRLARGAVLGWLNSDDCYEPGAVGAAMEYLDSHPEVDLVYGDCVVVDRSGRPTDFVRSEPFSARRLLTFDLSMPQCTMFFRRSLFERIGQFEPSLRLTVEIDFQFRAAMVARAAYVPGIRSRFRVHPAARSFGFHPSQNERRVILERLYADPVFRPPARWRREALAAAIVAHGLSAFAAGEHGHARRFLWSGLLECPHPLRLRTLKAVVLLGDAALGLPVGAALRAWCRRRRLRTAAVAPAEAP